MPTMRRDRDGDQYWTCDICGGCHDTEERARICESQIIRKSFDYQVGDFVCICRSQNQTLVRVASIDEARDCHYISVQFLDVTGGWFFANDYGNGDYIFPLNARTLDQYTWFMREAKRQYKANGRSENVETRIQ
jgi:hypothetical protein